uniref:Chloride channel K n=1 Tax=Mastacembelus armatus TaxID=205130 RepID=A0A7N8XQG9_9TELE
MKNLDETPRSERNTENNCQEEENQLETSHNKSPLLSDSWKPYQRPQWLLKLRCCLGAVCGMEWYGYAALGILTGFLSFLMDLSVSKLLRAHQWLYMKLEGHSLLQFLCWTLYPSCICVVGSSFSHSICPFSTGSGIPEVRAMLAGFEMPHYLSVTNLFTKYVGLICTLAAGSTIFLGKVGPFVHLSTMVGAYLSKLCSLDKAAGEMMVVAAAVGVASCFGAPVSGVLFSVEVMSSHFAVKHYVPCFFSTACGALTFHLFSVWSGDGETLQVLFKTNFPTALPFYPLEIVLFALLGLLCGAVSCCYLFCHRWILQYTMKQLLTSLLDGRQWTSESHNASVQVDPKPWLEWSSSGSSVYMTLTFFLLMKMWMLVLACTLPVPAGCFMPVFVYGAALGRLFGEGGAYVLSGLTSGQQWASINPGGYALAGAAAFSGAVTHTLSPALLAIELTGQFSHAVPALIATVLANARSRSGHRPSFYDAISISKRLPHLPSLKKACPWLPSTPVGQVLGAKAVQLQKTAGLVEVQHAVNSCTETQIPVVDSHGVQIFNSIMIIVLLQAHSILSLVGTQALFVTDSGRLVGLITWPEMKRILEDLAKEI